MGGGKALNEAVAAPESVESVESPTVARRRGRPRKAAQSLDEALAAVYGGTAPARPRNDHERKAQAKRRGRAPDPLSRTQQAAQLAQSLVRRDGRVLADAARVAAAEYGVNADNVRKYAGRLLKEPQVKLRAVVASPYRQLVGGDGAEVTRPLVVYISDDPDLG